MFALASIKQQRFCVSISRIYSREWWWMPQFFINQTKSRLIARLAQFLRPGFLGPCKRHREDENWFWPLDPLVLNAVRNLCGPQERALSLPPDVVLDKIVVVRRFHHSGYFISGGNIRPNFKDRQGIEIDIKLVSWGSLIECCSGH